VNYKKKKLKSNDKIEIVHFIGGGWNEKRYF
jgi:sulfur carrier protein ThiS